MKKFWMAVIAVLFTTAGVFAQQGAAPAEAKKTVEERATQFTRRMTNELQLDATQQERVKALNLDRFKQLEEVKSVTTLSKAEARAKIKTINGNFFTTVQGILTPEQQTKFQQMMEERKEKMLKRKGKM